jgi:DNA-directed RNA polymerase subunit RPC12/RpoP
MLVKEFKCQACGHHFEEEVLDRDDAREARVAGSPLRCKRCNSMMVEEVRVLRRRSITAAAGSRR